MNDTIFALSSGAVPAGVAVVRLSGPAAGTVLEAWCGRLPQPRRASLATLTIPGKAEILDRGLVLWMPGPGTFTGEDVAELHLHGSRAVLSRLFECLGQHPGTRAAERGEFTRRAFDNGRLDLPEVEGLADLIDAETEVQRRQAIRLAGGDLGRKCEAWRAQLIRFRAQAEAQLDFSDEGDVGELAPAFWVEVALLRSEIRSLLDRAAAGERVRLGYRVALVGPPNAGKSTLLNAIAGRDVAIVTDEAGTTRDVLEVPLDLGGYPVLLYDTAGLRDAESAAEQEGIRRARLTAEMADLVLWLREPADTSDAGPPAGPAVIWRIATKSDLGGAADGADYRVSARTGEGMGELLHAIQQQAMSAMLTDGGLVTRERHAAALRSAEATLAAARGGGVPLEITADLLRSASDAIGRVSGRVDVEDVLDSLFREFCIGK